MHHNTTPDTLFKDGSTLIADTMSTVFTQTIARLNKHRAEVLTQHDVLLSTVMLDALDRRIKLGGHVNGTLTSGVAIFGLVLPQFGVATCTQTTQQITTVAQCRQRGTTSGYLCGGHYK
jgi:hypothetical protein